MGKRLKKGQKPPSVNRPATFSKKVTKQSEQSVEITEEVVVTMTEKRSCVHFDKCVNLDKLLKTIKSSQQIKCGECKEEVHVKRGSKGSINSWKNGFSSSDSNSAKKAIWVCLECGYYVCGDVGLPTGSQSHVVQHIRLTRHLLVIQCENPQLRWCFPCQSLLPFEKEENDEKKDLLLEVVKLIRERSSNTSSVSVEAENSCSGSDSITGGIQEASDAYAVRGLVNLGNTCFFNSVMQNLLSLDQLREHFLNEDLSGGGPLGSSLKKLFSETKSEAGFFRSAINPVAFFVSVCSQPPQFRGYQQHDSHELLRCLLDGLSIEESSLRQKLGVSDNDDSFTHQKNTLIDSVFGGEISSTVSCLECGHTSKVYAPFLDLSLPVPSKKSPPEKQQTLYRAKKVLKNGAVSKDSEVVSATPASDHNSTVPILENPSSMALDDKQVPEIATESDTEYDRFWSDLLGPETSHNETDLVLLGDVSDTSPSTEAKGVNQTLVGSTETLMHDNDGIAKPETVPDKEDARATQSNEDTIASGISAEIDDFSSFFDEPEIPEGPVFRLPSKAEVSEAGFVAVSSNDKTVMAGMGGAFSSFMSCDNKQNRYYVDFISRLFDDPEISEGPVFGPPSKAKVSEAGFMAVSSDSDPAVLDDLDSPVSVDRCLAQFTKPEILSEDNAWHCENCSKNLKLQRLREKRKTKEGLSNGWVNENGASSAFDECRDKSLIQSCIDLENGYKAAPITESPNCKEEKNAIDDGILGDSDTKQAPITSSVTETPIPGGEIISSQPANGNECENWQDKAVDSENVTVKRAATKRILVNKAPPVLTIHLQRFSQDARGRLSKLSGHVEFKEFIDLSKYMDTRWTEEEQPVYRLAGLVEHLGTMRGGHYVAYIREGHKGRRDSDIKEPKSSIWYRASDSWVRWVSLEEVLRSEAYILFCERI